jgi:hypothetical protein
MGGPHLQDELRKKRQREKTQNLHYFKKKITKL